MASDKHPVDGVVLLLTIDNLFDGMVSTDADGLCSAEPRHCPAKLTFRHPCLFHEIVKVHDDRTTVIEVRESLIHLFCVVNLPGILLMRLSSPCCKCARVRPASFSLPANKVIKNAEVFPRRS